jgi:tRNA A37 threonylcarbamoyladenosine synthetase subunit TsaC/SUA5/YrdC
MTATVVSIFDVGDYDQHVARAAELIAGGGVAVLPTETVYGAAGRLDRPQAVARSRSTSPTATRPPDTSATSRTSAGGSCASSGPARSG